MNSAEVIDIGRDAIWVLLKLSFPIMMVALIVGLVVSLLQALTQLQEQTLVFVPKILAIFLALMFAMPFMLRTLADFNTELMEKVAAPDTPPNDDSDEQR
ncbi:MAG: flagellar biosynthesis protein FliQ [Rickettsiales bacterium]